MDLIYYRVRASDGAVIWLQYFDEADYDPSLWLTDNYGNPLKFWLPEQADKAYKAHLAEQSKQPKVLGYVVLGEDNKLYGCVPVKNKGTAQRSCDILNRDDEYGHYRVTQIVEVDQ